MVSRILCGNALDAAAFAALMGEERDPPYNAPIDGHASALGAIHHRPFPMASGEMSRSEFTAFLGEVCRNLAASGVAGSIPLHLHQRPHAPNPIAADPTTQEDWLTECARISGIALD